MSFYQDIMHHRVRSPIARVETEGPDYRGMYRLKIIHEDGSSRTAYLGCRTMAALSGLFNPDEARFSGVKGLQFDEDNAAEIILP